MKHEVKKSVGLLLAAIMFLSLSVIPTSAAITQAELEKDIAQSVTAMLKAVPDPQVGSIGGEWAVLGLARSGFDVPQSYYDKYLSTVEHYVKACQGVLDSKKYTEYSRVILALTAIGADPSNLAGYNLLIPLGDFEQTIWQGINGPIWALIALDSGNYEIPNNPNAKVQASRENYVDEILARQLDDGGWNLSDRGGSNPADADITGMALQALANYRDREDVQESVEAALACLSGMQGESGGFSSWGSGNCESCVQVIVALCALGIDLNDSRFVKNGNTLLDNLMSFRQEDGSFEHTAGGSGSNQMASEQGLYGMVTVLRMMKGEQSLYQMSDSNVSAQLAPEKIGLEGKDPAVKKTNLVAPGTTFSDISGENAHPNQQAIEAMAARGIINGQGDGTFAPDQGMTRADFAALVVRALGLEPETVDVFEDVPNSEWYAPYIGTAYSYGIVNGVSETQFFPKGTISRQEAAVMVMRAANLCGIKTELDAKAVRNVLAQFLDYMSSAEWARSALAFCYQSDILNQSDLDIRPTEPIKRCEVAQMLFHLLGVANLL